MVRLLGVLILSAMLVSGCSRGESLAQRAGKKVGETATDFAKGVGAGVDKQMTVNVELGKDVVEAGISKTVAKTVAKGAEGVKHGTTVYFVSTKPFKGTLVAYALNAEGLEIGRSAEQVELAADDAKYVTFDFPAEMDSQLVATYRVGIKK